MPATHCERHLRWRTQSRLGQQANRQDQWLSWAPQLKSRLAFRIEYGKEVRGFDVLVLAGLNNLIKGDSKEDVMRKLDLFKNTVIKQSQHLHPTTPNTFAVATLLYAP